MRATIQALVTGLRDGLSQPYEFNIGMTYDSLARQWIYDQASIHGQRITRLREAWKRPDLDRTDSHRVN